MLLAIVRASSTLPVLSNRSSSVQVAKKTKKGCDAL
jgi:hypothetical protein